MKSTPVLLTMFLLLSFFFPLVIAIDLDSESFKLASKSPLTPVDKDRTLSIPTSYSNSKGQISFYAPKAMENELLLAHNMEVKIRSDNSLKVTSNFVVRNNDSQPMNYFILQLNGTISSVFSFDPIGSLSFSWEVIQWTNILNKTLTSNTINVTMRYPLLQQETYVLSVSYEIDGIVYQIQSPMSYFNLDYEVVHSRKSDKFNFEIVLPIDTQLIEGESLLPVSPSPDKIFSEDSILKILWTFKNIEIGLKQSFTVRFQQATEIAQDNTTNLTALFIVLAFFSGSLIGALSIFLINKWRFKSAESELVTSLLSDTEQKVIKAINLDKGISTQRRICEKRGFSKSKVSQILLKLEEKEVVKRERWGRTNKVTLINPAFQKLGLEEESKVIVNKKEQEEA